jgi:hypothetical protein
MAAAFPGAARHRVTEVWSKVPVFTGKSSSILTVKEEDIRT